MADQEKTPGVKVFVYGTLLTGYYNHRLVEELVRATDVGVVSDFRLLDLGAFPGARPADGFGIRGEVLTLDDPREAIQRLDRLEGVPSLYTREKVRVALDDGTFTAAYMYVLAVRESRGNFTPFIEATEGGADSWRKHSPPRTLRGYAGRG